MTKRDPALDCLLDLDGIILVIDPETGCWVRFSVKRVAASEAKPHGLDYALTLHDAGGERLVGFDNAHPIKEQSGPGGKKEKAFDHKHRFKTVRPYDYTDAATLLADFWAAVDAVLCEKGIMT